MTDKVEKISNTLVQHGKQNNRVYIMKIDDPKDKVENIIEEIDILADKNKYTKIFAKVQDDLKNVFISNKYTIEAEVPGFYNGREKCLFMAKYLDDNRSLNKLSQITKEVLNKAKSKSIHKHIDLDNKYTIKKCSKTDATSISSLYSKVFETYPFPIFNPEYIKTMMNDNVIYFGVWDCDKLVAVSGIELYKDDGNAEMTDFATDTDYRGQNLSVHLLKLMENELKQLKIPTAYTIARAESFGMNSTFARLSYKYAGTLTNNTNIGGQIESMNVWFKNLEKDS